MIKRKVFKVIGLMSGTSMDGIDVSVVDTDGRHFFKSVSDLTIPYSDEFRAVSYTHLTLPTIYSV